MVAQSIWSTECSVKLLRLEFPEAEFWNAAKFTFWVCFSSLLWIRMEKSFLIRIIKFMHRIELWVSLYKGENEGSESSQRCLASESAIRSQVSWPPFTPLFVILWDFWVANSNYLLIIEKERQVALKTNRILWIWDDAPEILRTDTRKFHLDC